MVEVSWSPRAFLLKSFLSDKECQHFIDKVRAEGAVCSRLMSGLAVLEEQSGKVQQQACVSHADVIARPWRFSSTGFFTDA